MPETTFNTSGAIAKQAGVAIHKITYILKAYDFTPIGRAGRLRLYSEADTARIIEIAQSIEEKAHA